MTVISAMIEDALTTVLSRAMAPTDYSQVRVTLISENIGIKLRFLKTNLPPKEDWLDGPRLVKWIQNFEAERNRLAHSIVLGVRGTTTVPAKTLLNHHKTGMQEITPELDAEHDKWQACGEVLSIVVTASARHASPDLRQHDLRAMGLRDIMPGRSDLFAALDEMFPKT